MKRNVKHQTLRDSFLVAVGITSSALLVPQAWSLSQSTPPESNQGVLETPPINAGSQSSIQHGFRPIPVNRMKSAKGSSDEGRNPFAIDSPFASSGSESNNPSMAVGLSSLRLTGIVQEGSSLKALIEDGSEHASLALGDPLSLGVVQGLGYRVSAISFEKGYISITNGREERQISVQR